ncbi:MAG: HAMP domain-containing histidine kinase [Clostridia bacterium]|nr:HAMP domain-containing histidine kinase [Clostridia bacterium]
MKNKLKKQKRNIAIKIFAVLFAVWLIVSGVFFAVVTTIEKNTLIAQEKLYEEILMNRLSEYQNLPRTEVCSVVTRAKYHFLSSEEMLAYMQKTSSEEPLREKPNYFPYDKNMQIVVMESTGDQIPIIDTDKATSTTFFGIQNETKDTYQGLLNYDSYRASLTDDEFDTIKDYLSRKPDKEGAYYELICKEFYFDDENDQIIPKTVEIVKTKASNIWYAEDEPVETFELNLTESTAGLELYELPQDSRNVIDDDFATGEFASEGLIEDPYATLDTDQLYSSLLPAVTKISPLNYLYYNHYRFNTTEYTVVADNTDPEGFTEIAEHYSIIIKYAKKIDVLGSCSDTLILGIGGMFLFLLIIGIILTVMLWKVMKTQIQEEQKRREVTNALAHDIKTPLFIIEGYAQNLKENLYSDKKEHYADRIIERTKEVNTLVHKMLDFSKLDSVCYKLNSENIDMAELVNKVVSDFSEVAEERTLSLDLQGECRIKADRELIVRAVSNLIDNAVKHSDPNSVINIRLNSKELTISNTCSTITEKDLKHITEPFFTADSSRETRSNGLGLSTVKTIADMHGYKLSTELENNIFSISLRFGK